MKFLNVIFIIFVVINFSRSDEEPQSDPPSDPSEEPPIEPPVDGPVSDPLEESSIEDPSATQSYTDEFHTHIYDPVACTLDPAPTLDELDQVYQWIEQFQKHYQTARQRLCATIKVCYHLRQVTHHNRLYDAGLVTYKKGLTRFSDLSHDEKDETLLMHDVHQMPQFRYATKFPVLPPAREYVNYIEEGLVRPVGFQARCGSCYAWSGAAPLEAQLKRCGIFNESVSVQQMVDCPTLGVWGCSSGWPL